MSPRVSHHSFSDLRWDGSSLRTEAVQSWKSASAAVWSFCAPSFSCSGFDTAASPQFGFQGRPKTRFWRTDPLLDTRAHAEQHLAACNLPSSTRSGCISCKERVTPHALGPSRWNSIDSSTPWLRHKPSMRKAQLETSKFQNNKVKSRIMILPHNNKGMTVQRGHLLSCRFLQSWSGHY